MPTDEIDITELLEIDPSRVDAVGSPANGTPWLMLKSIDGDVTETEATLEDVLAELAKADDDERPPCKLCKGTGKIRAGKLTCPQCKGSGKMPQVGDTEKSLREFAALKEAGVAASGAPGSNAGSGCDTCSGTGMIGDKPCPDCDGKPFDPSATKDADNGSVTVGAGGRETIDKAEMSGKDQNDLPDSAFAYIESGGKKDDEGKTVPRSLRHFPVHDAAHARNALARASQSPFGAKAMPKIKAAAKKFGIEVSAKSVDLVEKDGMVSGTNPYFGANVSTATTNATADPDETDDQTPGSPGWEADDAECATAAATALMEAAELIRHFAGREAIEVAAGEGNDLFDTWDAECALDAVTAALGVMARLAFHEGVEAQKSGAVTKAGKRLSTKSVAALAAARDHLSTLLGDDDPSKASDDDAEKSKKDVLDMTPEELGAFLDEREAAKAAEIAKAKTAQDVDNTESIANAKAANAKAKKKNPKAENTDLEDEAEQGTNASASGTNDAEGGATGAAKAELTPEEIEANDAAKAAKKAAKIAKKAAKKIAKQAAEDTAVAKRVEESTAKAEQAVSALRDELEAVKKMAAPSTIVRTRPQDAAAKSTERDNLDVEIEKLERVALIATDPDIRKSSNERVKDLRVRRAAL